MCVCVCVYHLAFGSELLFVVFRGISRDLTRPQRDAHSRIGASHDAKGQEVDQQCHTNIISGTKKIKGAFSITPL